MKPTVSIIAIVARGGAIGRGGDQPFHVSADFRRFKALTMGKPIVMGRRTFEALPKGALPGRRNIVITSQEDWSVPGAERAHSLSDALALCGDAEEIMIIGGGTVYRQALPMAQQLLLTEVDADVPDADTFFPEVDMHEWTLASADEWVEATDRDPRYRFAVYHRCQ